MQRRQAHKAVLGVADSHDGRSWLLCIRYLQGYSSSLVRRFMALKML